jgi:predicted AAA+ superfamily ATPase
MYNVVFMEFGMKFRRWQEDNVKEALKTSRVTILAGARQCGKTTLANLLASADNDIDFRSLDDITMLTSAKADPHGFVHHRKRTLIIDGIRRTPDLLMTIKKEVRGKMSNKINSFVGIVLYTRKNIAKFGDNL